MAFETDRANTIGRSIGRVVDPCAADQPALSAIGGAEYTDP